eukprot:CAMPEP_0118942568 /NCGR_PEP_ID=MMETSP1169-20130426/36429_1 /TAXON_ID=36882 /ORGANISM="Pyramimonas obovata, Strain CCMP722" /LENGTH=56 /DNA_ID=CAMNT_0006887605 /DNA_START=123 /DNA_END=293 /DNA_ORIENTATION=-
MSPDAAANSLDVCGGDFLDAAVNLLDVAVNLPGVAVNYMARHGKGREALMRTPSRR